MNLLKAIVNLITPTKKATNKAFNLQLELSRKLKECNFKYIGGLNALEQMQVVQWRDNGKTQEWICSKLSTSRGSVIRIIEQRKNVIYIANVFTKIRLLKL